MDNFEEDDEVVDFEVEQEGQDINSVMAQIKEAWKCVPDLSFGEFLDLALNSYSPLALTASEMEEMLNEFIIQNQ